MDAQKVAELSVNTRALWGVIRPDSRQRWCTFFRVVRMRPARWFEHRYILKTPMSIIVSVKINDGIVMAADSNTTFFKDTGEVFQIYEHANKIVNPVKGLPIGVMTCGSGGIGNASIDTLLKDLRARLSTCGELPLDPASYTMEAVTHRVREFFSE